MVSSVSETERSVSYDGNARTYISIELTLIQQLFSKHAFDSQFFPI